MLAIVTKQFGATASRGTVALAADGVRGRWRSPRRGACEQRPGRRRGGALPALAILIAALTVGVSTVAPAWAEEGIDCDREGGVETLEVGQLLLCRLEGDEAREFVFLGSPEDRMRLLLTPRGLGIDTVGLPATRPAGRLCLEVFGPQGEALAQQCAEQGSAPREAESDEGKSPAVELDTALRSAGRHRLRVTKRMDGETAMPQGFDLLVERLAPASDRESALCWGCMVGESIAPAGDLDLYAVPGGVGERIDLQLSELSGFGEPCLELLDPTGERLARRCEANNPALSLELESAGRHSLVVSDDGHDETFRYHLTLARSSPGRSATGRLCTGCRTEADLALVGDLDDFAWTAAAGEQVRLLLTRTHGRGQPCLELSAPDGRPLGSDCGPHQAQIDLVPSQDGVYRLRVSEDNDDQTMAYSLAAERLEPTHPALLPLCIGCSMEESLAPAGDLDLYAFDGIVGEVFLVQLVGQPDGGNPCLEVLRPDGSTLAAECGEDRVRRIVTLDTRGGHGLLVSERLGHRELDYRIFLERLAPIAVSTPALEPGRSALARLDPPGEIDLFAFEGSPGEVFGFRLVVLAEEGEPCFELYRPDATLAHGNCRGSAAAEGWVRLDLAGTQTLVVGDRNDTATYPYRLVASRVAPPPVAAPRLCAGCDPLLQHLEALGSFEVLAIPGAVGDRLTVTADRRSSRGALCLEFLDPQGKTLERGCDPEQLRLPLIVETAGDHAVVIWDEGHDDLVAFSVSLDCRRRDGLCAASLRADSAPDRLDSRQ